MEAMQCVTKITSDLHEGREAEAKADWAVIGPSLHIRVVVAFVSYGSK